MDQFLTWTQTAGMIQQNCDASLTFTQRNLCQNQHKGLVNFKMPSLWIGSFSVPGLTRVLELYFWSVVVWWCLELGSIDCPERSAHCSLSSVCSYQGCCGDHTYGLGASAQSDLRPDNVLLGKKPNSTQLMRWRGWANGAHVFVLTRSEMSYAEMAREPGAQMVWRRCRAWRVMMLRWTACASRLTNTFPMPVENKALCTHPTVADTGEWSQSVHT